MTNRRNVQYGTKRPSQANVPKPFFDEGLEPYDAVLKAGKCDFIPKTGRSLPVNEPDTNAHWSILINAPDVMLQNELIALAARHKLREFNVTSRLNPDHESETEAPHFRTQIIRVGQKKGFADISATVEWKFSFYNRDGDPVDWKALLQKAGELLKKYTIQAENIPFARPLPNIDGIFYRDYHKQYEMYKTLCIGPSFVQPPLNLLYMIGWPQNATEAEEESAMPSPLRDYYHKPFSASGWLFFSSVLSSDVRELGWKFHISVADERAQKELVELAAKYKVPVFKIATIKTFERMQNPLFPQAGKTMVLYYGEKNYDGEQLDWVGFLQDADKIVRKYKSGPPVQRDRAVPETEGIFYRNDIYKEKYVPRRRISDLVSKDGVRESL